MCQVGHCPLLHHVWLTPHSSAAIGSSNGIYVISAEHGINQPSDQPADIQHLSITVTPAQMLKIRHAVTGSLSLLIYRRYPTGDCFALLLLFFFSPFFLIFLLLPSDVHFGVLSCLQLGVVGGPNLGMTSSVIPLADWLEFCEMLFL